MPPPLQFPPQAPPPGLSLPPAAAPASAASEAAAAAAAASSSSSSSSSARLLAWLVLCTSVVAMSSGGVWFAALASTPAALRASWRLTATALLQAPFFAAQLRAAPPALRARVRREAPALCGAGAALALHFAAWSYAVAHTSLANSLLFVSTTPLLIVCWALLSLAAWRVGLCGRPSAPPPPAAAASSADGDDAREAAPLPLSPPSARTRCCGECSGPPLPPTFLELVGTLLGFVVAALLDLTALDAPELAASGGDGAGAGAAPIAPSLRGDAFALLGAAAMVVYLSIGSRLRAWMPLFLYAFPVTAAAALICGAASLALEGAGGGLLAADGALGWLGSGQRFGLTLGAAAVSGFLGHTGANFALTHISPLILSVLLLLEPAIGSLLGWLVGLQLPPDALTLACGAALIACVALVTLGDRTLPFSARAWAALTCGRGARASAQLPAAAQDDAGAGAPGAGAAAAEAPRAGLLASAAS